MKKRNIIMTVREVPYDLRARFRLTCMKMGMTMQQAIVQLMEAFIKAREDEDQEKK